MEEACDELPQEMKQKRQQVEGTVATEAWVAAASKVPEEGWPPWLVKMDRDDDIFDAELLDSMELQEKKEH